MYNCNIYIRENVKKKNMYLKYKNKKSLTFINYKSGEKLNMKGKSFKVLICIDTALGMLTKFKIYWNIVTIGIKSKCQNTHI